MIVPMNFCQNTIMLLLMGLAYYVKSGTKHKIVTDFFNSHGYLKFKASGYFPEDFHNTEIPIL